MVKIADEQERFSFSKLSSFHKCKYGFKQTYIEHKKGIGNCFSSYGLEIHSIMERYAKGELDLWDLVDIYNWEFDAAVPEQFPSTKFCKDMRKLYYDQGLNYLKNFPGYNKYNILEVEETFDIQIEDWIFTGIIDLVFEDENGNLIIQDYKSKSSFKNNQEKKEYARQLYLYALHIKEKYGKFPKILRFMMFRKQTPIDIIFNENDYNEAILWAKNTVQEIRSCQDYPPSCETFYSQNLCNHREYCDKKEK